CLSTSSSVPLAWRSSSVLIAFTALWNLARRLYVWVSACVRSCLRLQRETKALCHCRASMEQDAKLAEASPTVCDLEVRHFPSSPQISVTQPGGLARRPDHLPVSEGTMELMDLQPLGYRLCCTLCASCTPAEPSGNRLIKTDYT
ncbi:hypothetical protein AMECASPLE_016071, partial [Ameca splendens]